MNYTVTISVEVEQPDVAAAGVGTHGLSFRLELDGAAETHGEAALKALGTAVDLARDKLGITQSA